MGQTLTHGIYLPDEGERNCYNGLASNWSILDGAVGTVAEHTSQIAGKAPAVHTHTKSNVTDLLNSNFIPSANNSYDLGSSSYQWKSIYAQSYYYNGVAWGLDKVNIWSKNNSFSANCIVYNPDNSGSVAMLKLRNSKAEVLSTGNTSSDQSMTFRDKNDVAIGYIKGAVQSNSVALKIGAYAKDSSNNVVNTELQILAFSNGNKAIFPSTTDAYDLGTSTNKWKTLNGIDPGALSLPSNIGYDPIDTRNWDLTGNPSSPNWYTPTVDGWLCVIALAGTMTDAWLDVWVDSLWGQSASQSPSGELFCIIPVRANLNVRIRVKASYIFDARLFVATGNV